MSAMGKRDAKKELNDYLRDCGLEVEFPNLSGEFEIVDSASYGLIFNSNKYPNVVYKWFYDGQGLHSDTKLVPESKRIGYNLEKKIKKVL